MLAIHGLYVLYFKCRSLVLWTSAFLTGIILTSSTRELIKSDISTLNKLPSHLALIVTQRDLALLLDEVSEVAAWSICCAIPMLTIYEERGNLKGMDSSLQVAIKRKLRRYFRDVKKIKIITPSWGLSGEHLATDEVAIPDLEINILSRDDGREAILEITKSLCNLACQSRLLTSNKRIEIGNKETKRVIDIEKPELSRSPVGPHDLVKAASHKRSSQLRGKLDASQYGNEAPIMLSSQDVTISFLDAHLAESTISEPNLLLVFSSRKSLEGFPPWSLRLCEIYYAGEFGHVTYRAFLKGLQRYARAEMRFGH